MMPSSVCHDSELIPYTRSDSVSLEADPPTSKFERTAGVWANNEMRPLRPVGVSSNVSRVNAVRAPVDATSTMGEAPETVTDSCTDPTLRETSTVATKPAVSRKFSRRTDSKPASVYTTMYVPIGNGVRRYSPRSLVTPTN